MRRVLATLAALFIAVALTFAQAPTASAKVGGSLVGNWSGKSVKIACNYGGSLKTLPNGQTSYWYCTADNHDVDQVLVSTTVIGLYTGPKAKDGCYRIAPNVRAKIPDMGTMSLYKLSSGCRGKKYHGYWSMR